MSIGIQLSMSPSILKNHDYALLGGGTFQSRLTPCPGVANASLVSPANAQCSVDQKVREMVSYQPGVKSAMAYQLEVKPSSTKAFRFLPYAEDHVTYTELDDNAQLVITGPLSGCFVYAAVAGDKTILLHANANKTTGIGNSTAKIDMITRVLDTHYTGWGFVGRLVNVPSAQTSGATSYDGYSAFVVGTKAKAGLHLSRKVGRISGSLGHKDWSFYVYGFNGTDRIFKPL